MAEKKGSQDLSTPKDNTPSSKNSEVSKNNEKIEEAKDELKEAAKATGRENIIGDISNKNPDPKDPDEVKSFLKEVRDMVKELFEDHKAKKAKENPPPPEPPKDTPKPEKWYERNLF